MIVNPSLKGERGERRREKANTNQEGSEVSALCGDVIYGHVHRTRVYILYVCWYVFRGVFMF